jgi:hypothetical protein
LTKDVVATYPPTYEGFMRRSSALHRTSPARGADAHSVSLGSVEYVVIHVDQKCAEKCFYYVVNVHKLYFRYTKYMTLPKSTRLLTLEYVHKTGLRTIILYTRSRSRR